MLLTIDVGNTQIALGMFDEDDLIGHWRVSTEPLATFDEIRWQLTGILGADGFAQSDILGVCVSSVVPAMTATIRRVAPHVVSGSVVVVEPGVRTGLAIEIDNPREVGADRIVNAVAAYDWAQAGVVVVDFGTATTFDCISPDGEYLGGVIAPGIQISAEALFSRASRLHRVDIARPPHVVGRNTAHSMQSGIVYGYAGLVDGLCQRLDAELGFDHRIVATGGHAPLIAAEAKYIERIDPNLTLTGLRLVYERNRPHGP